MVALEGYMIILIQNKPTNEFESVLYLLKRFVALLDKLPEEQQSKGRPSPGISGA